MELEEVVPNSARPNREAAKSEEKETVPAVRARYEQSLPRVGRLVGDNSGGTVASGSIMDRTHGATTVDEAAQSTYSYDSARDWTSFFKEVDGRRFSSQAAVYILPAGE
jgi:hypothetical protein